MAGDPCTKRCYFADYEVLVAGRPMFWGNSTFVYSLGDLDAFDPEALSSDIKLRAATVHHVSVRDVRIRNICRL